MSYTFYISPEDSKLFTLFHLLHLSRLIYYSLPKYTSDRAIRMTIPSTQKKWIITGEGKGLDDWQFIEGPIPEVHDNEVLVKLHAATVNPRDHQIPQVGCNLA